MFSIGVMCIFSSDWMNSSISVIFRVSLFICLFVLPSVAYINTVSTEIAYSFFSLEMNIKLLFLDWNVW